MSTVKKNRLFLTGASGLLGRAIFAEFTASNWKVYGTALSRVGPGLNKLDLLDKSAVEKAFAEFKPTFVIHCAAQRFPDKVDSDLNAALRLNVEVTKQLAEISKTVNAPVLYISTDYVFDGKSPPFKTTDKPNPINMYGKTKLQGEEATLSVSKENVVLRIPVIYGPVEWLGESAVTVLLSNLMDVSKPSQVSNYERRCPSSVNDIAKICLQLAEKRVEDSTVSGIFQWCGKEMFTKYTMVLEMAALFNIPHDHIKPMNEVPDSLTARPYDTTLDTSRIEALHMGVHTPFKAAIHEALKGWVANRDA